MAQKLLNAHQSAGATVDILRLSTVAKKNLAKEQEENVSEQVEDAEANNYHSKASQAQQLQRAVGSGQIKNNMDSSKNLTQQNSEIKSDDIKLQSRNVVLNFAD